MSHGITVGVVGDPTDVELAFERIAAGLSLIAEYEPQVLHHMRRCAKGILVWSTPSARAIASWHPEVKLIVVNERFLCNSQTTPRTIAATLVHETTHARLMRFGYRPSIRARIELICHRREREFARRMPDSHQLVEGIERQLRRDPSDWSDDAHVARTVRDLTELGVPSGLIRLFLRLTRPFR
jgi:hypothetical protein